MKLQISATSNKILRLFFDNGNKPLYVNEIVRQTNLYPNSVQRALKTLEQQGIVSSKAKGNRRFFTLIENQKHISLLKSMFNASAMNTRPFQKYIKWVNRECSVALNAAIGSAQCDPKYIKRFRIEPVTFLWYNSVTGGVYNSFEQVVKTGERISKEVKRDASFAKNLANSCVRDGEKLITETRKSAKKDLTQLTDKQLYHEFDLLHELFLRFMPYYVIPHAIEKAIESELDERVFKQNVKEKLIEPVSVLSDEQTDELKLATLVKEKGWVEESERALQELRLNGRICW